MKIFEIKNELEKVSRVLPELRSKLDDAYSSSSGKKGKIKLLWKEYEAKHKEMRNSKDYKNLDLH